MNFRNYRTHQVLPISLLFGVFALIPTTSAANAQAQNSGAQAAGAQPAAAAPATGAPVKRFILKPGQELDASMDTEDIVPTDEVDLAQKQVQAYPDNPEASFILAVALTRTSRVEQALNEVRRARKLAENKGGPAYFDKMIETYEKMLQTYPEDNRVRYGLAWAYYMKAYLVAKYSLRGAPPQPIPAAPVAAAPPAAAAQPAAPSATPDSSSAPAAPPAADATAAAGASPAKPGQLWSDGWAKKDEQQAGPTAAAAAPQTPTTAAPAPTKPEEQFVQLPGFPAPIKVPEVKLAMNIASPAAMPQVKQCYQVAMKHLDDILTRNPKDLWTRVYRAHLMAEATGNVDEAMAIWRQCQQEFPDSPAPYFFLGEGYLKQGNLKECVSNVSRAIALRAAGK